MKRGIIHSKALIATAALATVCGTLVATTAAADSPSAPSDRSVRPASARSSVAVTAPVSHELRVKALPDGGNRATKSPLTRWGGDPRVTAYWTTKRMASAIPLDTPRSTAATQRELRKLDPAGAPALKTLSRPAAARKSGVKPKTAPPVTNFSSTNGKVFFHNQTDGRNYVCSGSAVNSASRRLVITAGHCVHGGPGGQWHSNWQFVPGYYQGSRPYGTFQAYRLRTYSDWINYGESGRGFNSDVGFVTTFTNAWGQRVVDAVGGHGTQSGGSRVFDVDIFGYPANLNQGQIMWACWGTTGTRWIGFYLFPSLSGCNFGGGSSGGPWLAGYSNSSGLGYVRSVTSNGPADNAYINGPYFDSRFPSLFANANNDW
jgi:V8-like Glu-specific endopeptidase